MAFGEEGYNPFQAEHAQCNSCGKMLRGPHKDTYFADKNVFAADKERVYTREEAEAAGLRHNVSGSLCPSCVEKTKAAWRASAEHRAAVKEQRRLAREQEKIDKIDYEQNIAPAERARAAYAERAQKSAEVTRSRQAYRDEMARRARHSPPGEGSGQEGTG